MKFDDEAASAQKLVPKPDEDDVLLDIANKLLSDIIIQGAFAFHDEDGVQDVDVDMSDDEEEVQLENDAAALTGWPAWAWRRRCSRAGLAGNRPSLAPSRCGTHP